MAKVKTATEPQEALAITTPTPRKRGGKPLAVEQHTVVKTWAEEVKIGAPTPTAKSRKQIIADEIEEDEADDVDIELPDEVQQVLAEYNTGDGLIMEVNRLPHYHLNGKRDPASMVCCGDRDFDPQEYKNILRLYYAREGVPNFFVIKLKSPDRRWIPGGTIGPVSVEAATAEEKARHGIYVAPPEHNGMPPPVALTYTAPSVPQEPIDRMAGIRETVSLLKEFQEIGLIPKLERSKEPVIVQQNPQQQFTEEDHIIRAALSTPEAQERVSKGILGKILGGAAPTDEAPYWFEPVVTLVTEFARAVAPGVSSLLQVSAQAKQLEIQRVAQANGAQYAPPEQPQAEIPQVPPMQFAQPASLNAELEPPPGVPREYFRFFNKMLEIKRAVLPPDKNAAQYACGKLLDWIDKQAYPSADGALNDYIPIVEELLQEDAAKILSYAAFFVQSNPQALETVNQPDVLPWLKGVQDEIRKEWAQQDEPVE